MVKKWKDFDEVVKPTRVPKDLWKYEDEMKKKPNFEHISDKKKRKKKKK